MLFMKFWIASENRSPGNLVRELGNPPKAGLGEMWLGGVLLAALLVIVGAGILLKGSATLRSSLARGEVPLTGTAAIAFAVAFIAAGAFLHFHFFWGMSRSRQALSRGGKIVSLLTITTCFGYIVWRVVNPPSWSQ